MDCARARSLLHPWLDGELEREQHREVVEHLAALRAVRRALQGRAARSSPASRQGLQARCPAELRAKLVAFARRRRRLRARGVVISFRRAAAAAAVLAVAFVWTDPICLRGCPDGARARRSSTARPPAAITTATE